MQVAPEGSPVTALVGYGIQVLHGLHETRMSVKQNIFIPRRGTLNSSEAHPTLLGGQQREQRAAVHLSHQQLRHAEDKKTNIYMCTTNVFHNTQSTYFVVFLIMG